MRKITALFAAAALLALWTGMAAAANHQVKIHHKHGIGKYLTDAKGMTLYWFTKDSPGHSACAGNCLERWPVYYREKVKPPKGIKAKDFGTVTREDGKKQTTFRGYPLYYWAGDKKPGDTFGQAANNVWFVVNPHKFPPKK